MHNIAGVEEWKKKRTRKKERKQYVCVCVWEGGMKDEANRYARTPTAASVTKHTQTIRST